MLSRFGKLTGVRWPQSLITPAVRAAASPRCSSSRSAPSRVEACTEAGILTAEEGHVQPGQPAQVGGASIVDREPCAEPGDRDGCEQGHDRKPAQTAVDHDDPRRLTRLVGFLQKTRQRERCAETAGLARIGSDAALRGHSISTSAAIRWRWFARTERVVS